MNDEHYDIGTIEESDDGIYTVTIDYNKLGSGEHQGKIEVHDDFKLRALEQAVQIVKMLNGDLK